jgi:hypothetical protein
MGDRPVVARTAEGGHSLVVFVPSGRRSALAPGERLEDASLGDLESSSVEMTATEILIDLDEVMWLAQASGPVWADAAAADSAGFVFTALDGSGHRVTVTGLPPGPLPDQSELRAVLNGALTDDT